ncbi:hypothetical protein [Kocuria sp. SL71]|uniref:hypothetical protein n=1 Tax=Kocuria sp. SL71 TaxID=2995151 RepID=UPI0004B7DAAD|nr:hypothetical protein [Kocuria sp. SL71]MCY1684627.1 hypothetical protein [Kocuria sp. SL71]
MSVRRSAQIITAAVPLLLVGAAAPALALDQAPPAAVETAAAQEGLSVPLEISGIVDGLSDRETAQVEAFALGIDGQRESLGSVQVDSEGRYLLQGAVQPGAPVLLEATVWESGHEDEALSTWYGDSPDLAGAEALGAVGSMDGIDISVARQQVPESETAAAVPASESGLAASGSQPQVSSDRDAQRLVLALLATGSFVGGLALLRRSSAQRLD